MATCIVSGTLLDPSETAISGANVSFDVQSPILDLNGVSLLGPKAPSTTTASDGTWSLTLSRGISGILSIDVPPDSLNGANRYEFTIAVPVAATATFPSVWVDPNSPSSVIQPAQLPDGQIWVGNAANLPIARTISGDATLSNTGVLTLLSVGTPGTYTKVTTDTKGRVSSGTTLSSGDIPNNAANTSGTAAGLSTILAIASGGTGQITANAALNALLPAQAGNNGKVVGTNGSNTSWVSAGGTGTVTSVAMSVPSFLSIAGSPVTAAGTLAVTLSGTALPVANGGTGQTTAPVTSVAMSVPSDFSVAGSPITSTGTLAVTYATQTARTFLAGPLSGSAAAPTFKAFTPPLVTTRLSGSSATHTFTTNPAPLYIRVRMVGGGGGGAGAGAGSPSAGGTGGTSTFGTSLLSCTGGVGGVNGNGVSAGGTASLGSGPAGTALSGGTGDTPNRNSASPGGSGAASPFGGAGSGGTDTGTVGTAAAANTGSGGGGATDAVGNNGGGGGAGGFIDALISGSTLSGMSGSATYTVGAAGTAGTGSGIGAANGGAGGAGIIEITEYYQ